MTCKPDLQTLKDVILNSYRWGISLQSDYARANALHLGAAASLGYVTTQYAPGRYDKTWRPTMLGLEFAGLNT